MCLSKLLKKGVGEKDKREEKIEKLLQKSLEEWGKTSLIGKDYLQQAISLKLEIENEKGQVYFEKYPKIPEMIDETINKLTEYES